MKRVSLPLATALTLGCLWGAAPAAADLVPVRLTGGGQVENPAILNPVILSAALGCQLTDKPSFLQVESFSLRFTLFLDGATSAFCAPNNPGDPNAGGVYRGSGNGTCGGLPASADYVFIVGFTDSAFITVTGHTPACNFSVAGPLVNGDLKLKFVAMVDD